jgi:hypothetical protein
MKAAEARGDQSDAREEDEEQERRKPKEEYCFTQQDILQT